MKPTLLFLLTLAAVGCMAEIDDSNDAEELDVGVSTEALDYSGTSSNNSCLNDNGCTRGQASQSIASDSRHGRAAMRGYLKRKSSDLFACQVNGGNCFRLNGAVSSHSPGGWGDYYRVDDCANVGTSRAGTTVRNCNLRRCFGSSTNSNCSQWQNEATLVYADNIDDGHFWTAGNLCSSCVPTQISRRSANKLFNPPSTSIYDSSMDSMCSGTTLCGGAIPCPVPTAICAPSGSMWICPKC